MYEEKLNQKEFSVIMLVKDGFQTQMKQEMMHLLLRPHFSFEITL